MNFNELTVRLSQSEISEAISEYVNKNTPENYICSTFNVEVYQTDEGLIAAEVDCRKLKAQDK